jgi:lysozyme
MNAAAALTFTAAGALLIASSRTSSSSIEAAAGDVAGAFHPAALIDRAETLFNVITEEPANVDTDTASRNVAAFLQVLQQAEGTAGQPDPYRVCYGYSHTLQSFVDHPAVTGEWGGLQLPDGMCAAAGFGPGCVSTAAGAYQLIRPTWLKVRTALRLADFSPASQDAAAVELIRRRGGLEDVRAGRFSAAVAKCRNEWASLPGNYARQGQRSLAQLADWFTNAGGITA